jgi:hypothetical protein
MFYAQWSHADNRLRATTFLSYAKGLCDNTVHFEFFSLGTRSTALIYIQLREPCLSLRIG